MKRIPFFSLFTATITLLTASAAPAFAADPVAELGSFSVFQNIVPAQLLKGDVKTARSPAMNAAQDISVQSVYVVPGTPADALKALQMWDASRHAELKILVHGDLSGTPSAASFSKLASAPATREVKALGEKTAKASTDLQISAEEAKKLASVAGETGKGFSEGVRNAWAGILAGRAATFASGGVNAQPGYDHTGKNVRPGAELAGLLRQQGNISKQFGGFLDGNGVRGGGSLKKDMYYEMLNVDDEAVLTLGSFSSKPAANGSFQAADVSYYASGGYYATLTLYQMWPVDVDGKPATLVWRGDLIASSSLAELHGAERTGAEGATMKDIARTVKLLRNDTAQH